MTDLNQGGEPDIDSMSDEEFATFKGQMADAKPESEPEAEEKPAPKPEPTKQDAGDDDDDAGSDEQGGDKQETVPHGRFHRERERRKQLEQQMADERRRYEVLEQRTNALLTMQQERVQALQPPQPKEEVPDRATDPLAYLEYMDKRIQRFEETGKQQAEAAQREHQERQLINEVAQRAGADYQQALSEDPSYQQAYEFMLSTAVREKMAVEGLTEAVAVREVQRQELQIYYQALQRGQRPSAVIKSLAQARGWQPTPPETEEQPDVTKEAERIAKLNVAKDAAKSLSGSGSEARSGNPTPKDVVDMTDEEFAAFKAKYGENAMARVMGG